MDTEERKQFAEEVAKASKSIKRPWWLSWGIPTAVLGILSFLTMEIYQGINDDLAQNRETDSKQNESLASITIILEGMKEADSRNAANVAAARQDPWTATDDAKKTTEVYKRIDRNELRIDRLEQTQQKVLMDAVEVKSKLQMLESD